MLLSICSMLELSKRSRGGTRRPLPINFMTGVFGVLAWVVGLHKSHMEERGWRSDEGQMEKWEPDPRYYQKFEH